MRKYAVLIVVGIMLVSLPIPGAIADYDSNLEVSWTFESKIIEQAESQWISIHIKNGGDRSIYINGPGIHFDWMDYGVGDWSIDKYTILPGDSKTFRVFSVIDVDVPPGTYGYYFRMYYWVDNGESYWGSWDTDDWQSEYYHDFNVLLKDSGGSANDENSWDPPSNNDNSGTTDTGSGDIDWGSVNTLLGVIFVILIVVATVTITYLVASKRRVQPPMPPSQPPQG